MRLGPVLTAAVALLAAVACGGEPAPVTTAPVATAPATTSAAEPSPTPATSRTPRPDPGPADVPLDQVRVALEPVAVAQAPTALVARADEALYIAERGGTVRALLDGAVSAEPLLDISDQVSTGGERGLLGIAFSRSGDELYASYTNTNGDSRLVAYPVVGDRADRAAARELLAVEQPFANHNGGNVVLGPDGKLYLGLGDGGAANDPEGNAQDPGTLLGKLVRLEPSDGSAPDDNPFVGQKGYQPEIFALGLRNPWRFSFDRGTGDLWVGDVGQNSVEEVNVTPAADSAGRNYAWDIFEGTEPFEGSEQPPRAVLPVAEYPTAEGCAVTGGFVYRGEAIPELEGAYLYSDFCAGWVRALRMDGQQIVDRADLGVRLDQLASFGEDASGELYVVSLGGQIQRLVSR